MNLIILTDLYGAEASGWLNNYISFLSSLNYNVIVYDSIQIGKVDISSNDADLIHSQFIEFGIKNVVDFLLNSQLENSLYIGFSIGGFIAWQAIENGLPAIGLYCLSSTRIRYKSVPLQIPVKLVYGELDPFKPDESCLKNLLVKYEIFQNNDHLLYSLDVNISTILSDFHCFLETVVNALYGKRELYKSKEL